MAIESKKLRKYKGGPQKRSSPTAGILKLLLAILIIIPIAFLLTEENKRMTFLNFQLGQAYEKLGKKSTAMQYYEGSFEASDKEFIKARIKVAQMNNDIKKYGEAIKITDDMIESIKADDPRFLDNIRVSEVYYENGRANESQGNVELATVSYIKASDYDPESYKALIALGRVHRLIGQYKKSIKYLEQARDLSNLRAPEAHYEMGLTYLADGKDLDALDEFDLALKQLPSKEVKTLAHKKKLEVMSRRK